MTVFELAYRLLGQYEAGGKYVNLSLNSHLTDGLTKENKALLTALLYKTVEKKLTYDYYIAALSRRSIDKISPEVRDAVRLGLCALLDMNSFPDHAAVNGAVNLVGHKGERAFVNGVLRSAAREKEKLPLPDKSKNLARYCSVYYSIPLSTVKYFISLLGEDSAVSFFESVNTAERKTTLTVNRLKISVDGYIKKLTEHGYSAYPSSLSPLSVCINGSVDPRALPGFCEGEFFVQDEASALAALTLGAEAGDSIADVCSAPGGKSFLLGIISGDKAFINSYDLHESKISLISSGAERLGLNSVKASCRDALIPDEQLFGRLDRVLCDVPCSGLGVLSKKPDLRYKDITELSELSCLQLQILTASSSYLRAGGELVYSTCTLRKEENEEVVRAFLDSNSDFEAVDFSLGSLSSKGGSLTLYPHVHGTDGFFISKLRKKK